jgi:hypothetical protein
VAAVDDVIDAGCLGEIVGAWFADRLAGVDPADSCASGG